MEHFYNLRMNQKFPFFPGRWDLREIPSAMKELERNGTLRILSHRDERRSLSLTTCLFYSIVPIYKAFNDQTVAYNYAWRGYPIDLSRIHWVTNRTMTVWFCLKTHQASMLTCRCLQIERSYSYGTA